MPALRNHQISRAFFFFNIRREGLILVLLDPGSGEMTSQKMKEPQLFQNCQTRTYSRKLSKRGSIGFRSTWIGTGFEPKTNLKSKANCSKIAISIEPAHSTSKYISISTSGNYSECLINILCLERSQQL